MKTRTYSISKKAVSDLEEIWLYTVEKWSAKQADRYYDLIFDEINYICRNSDPHWRRYAAKIMCRWRICALNIDCIFYLFKPSSTMKKNYLIFIIIILLINSSYSCISQNPKIEANKNIDKAEFIINNNLSIDITDSLQIKLKKALVYLNNAIALDSLNIRAYNDKINVLEKQNNIPRVIETLQQLLRIQPLFAEGFIKLGIFYNKMNLIDSSKMAFENAKLIFLERPATDLRNENLILTEYLITRDKQKALDKLKEYPIRNLDKEESLKKEINEMGGNN